MVKNNSGYWFEPGYFLADDENVVRLTGMITEDIGWSPLVEGRKVVMPGAYIEDGPNGMVGLVYEPVDVTDGPAAGSIVVRGTVYEQLLSFDLAGDDRMATMQEQGFVFIGDSPRIERPGAAPEPS